MQLSRLENRNLPVLPSLSRLYAWKPVSRPPGGRKSARIVGFSLSCSCQFVPIRVFLTSSSQSTDSLIGSQPFRTQPSLNFSLLPSVVIPENPWLSFLPFLPSLAPFRVT